MGSFKGLITLLFTAMIYGTFGIFVRYLSHDLTGFQLNIAVNFLVIVLALVYSLCFKIKLSLHKKAIPYLLLYGIFFGLAATGYTLAILNTKVATAVFGINTSGLILSLLIGLFFFKERFTVRKAIGIALALMGLVFFTYPLTPESFDIGLLYGLLTGTMGVTANSVGKYAAGKVHDQLLIMARCLGPVICSIALVLANKEFTISEFSGFTFLLLGFFAIGIYIASNLGLVGFRNFDLNLGTVVLSAELLFAALFAGIIFGEYPKQQEILGCLLILAAIAISNIPQKLHAKKK